MDRATWEAALAEDGFAIPLDRRMAGGEVVPEHTHPFDARVLVLEGEYLLTEAGTTRRYGPGEGFELPANIPHAEAVGPKGAVFLVGRRPV